MATKKSAPSTGLSDKQALTLALQEMNEGAPAGTYANLIQDLTTPAPEQPPTADWASALSRMGTPAGPTEMGNDWTDAQAMQQMQDQAQADQDRRLAQVFGLPAPSGQLDTNNLPSSIDRYLEKILA